jgi:phenylalanine-4-hydroxylase
MSARAVTEKIPEYLLPYIVEQDPSLYTPIDHASWRFILRISRAFFANYAHQKYQEGLRETGISTERIPLIQEIDLKLKRFGWRAVAVSGFIPPAVFMEFLSLGILPIACDMRTLEHLAYTPAPDIVHEAAGHAPIIADPEYASYLREYGEMSRKAIYSAQDLAVYEAVRNLSDVKENPASTPAEIDGAQTALDQALASVDHVTEATELARMSWWTIEYGLVGSVENPKIYGAGLLSSVGESYLCLSPKIKRLPLTVDCIQMGYDITKPQPQLFVSPDFATLTQVLKEFGKKMAFQVGGNEGLEKAKKAQLPTTTVFESGIQVSGLLSEIVADSKGNPGYLIFKGPCQLSHQDHELPGQGATHHPQGFGTAIGILKDFNKSPADLTEAELKTLQAKRARMEYQSGVVVEGEIKDFARKDGKTLFIQFENAKVTWNGRELFKPEWGSYELACGSKVISVFADAADRPAYLAAIGGYKQKPGKQKTNLTAKNKRLNELYAEVRKIREEFQPSHLAQLGKIYAELKKDHPDDWLLRYELLEINATRYLKAPFAPLALVDLGALSKRSEEWATVISRGLELL